MPPQLLKNVFTTAAIDNIDHNPSATSAKSAFHGTCTSIFQHPSSSNEGESRDIPFSFSGNSNKVPELPLAYTNVAPAHLDIKKAKPTPVVNIDLPSLSLYDQHFKSGFDWLESVNVTSTFNGSHAVTWSAFHAKDVRTRNFQTSIISMLPLLHEAAHSISTLKHLMGHVIKMTSYLNPGQTAVIAADQPVYACMKQVQWQWPEECGESKAVIMLGGLHIEMAIDSILGSLLQSSGWSSAFSDSEVSTSGRADSFLAGSHVCRTREAHQIAVCALC